MADGVTTLASWERGAVAERRRRPSFLRKLARNRGALVGAFVLLVIIGMGTLAPVLAQTDPNQQHLRSRLQAPFEDASRPLGGDQLGRDVVSRLIYGSRIALIVGFASVAISGSLGIALGLIAGYYGGRMDDLISWVGNVFLAFPFFLLALAVVAILGGGLRNMIIVLAATSWMSYMRIVRGEVLTIRDTAFVEAAHTVGVGDARLLIRHVFPNVLTPVIVIATFEVARMIISESALSFLGLGVGSQTPSWGAMLADGRTYLATAWWVATFPGIAIMITVLAINLLGDWLRDELDPRITV
ncbi:MAG: peptide/nickel transport system permease protein [Thermomicrobiales bacterium]|nr:peptide/nickel transport system permease protein [Thermomicrobiales bacterium]MEA2529126.1 peptide/nickel transport system permease protein [Thermomicrobiales bacterium]MEA2594497.1 peptide/nickel transport system permease protein [Thermomicrobiales bacterium]